MEPLLQDSKFDFVEVADKELIVAFDLAMGELGYTCGSAISDGYCWGKYMIIYTKSGVKSKKSYARIYIRDADVILRLYFSNVDKHRTAIEHAPHYVQEAFTGDFPACGHCGGKTECIHQKRYTLHGKPCEVCDGKAFWFFRPTQARLPAYLDLFQTFYPPKKQLDKPKQPSQRKAVFTF